MHSTEKYGDLHIQVDLTGMPLDEQERFRAAMLRMQKAMATAVGKECEAFIRSQVKRRFNEVFTCGFAFGVCAASFVVLLGKWAQ